MISDNFYPEAYSLNNGEISLTADVLTLADTIADNMLPYYIGYVSYENMPTHWKFNTAEIVDDNTVIVSAITQNYGWGFLYHWNDIDGSNIALMRPCLIADVSGTKKDLSLAGYSHHFVNHGIIASANFANKFRLFFCYIAMPTSWLTDDDSCIYSKWAGHYCEALTKDVYLSWEQIEDFLDNDATITLTGLSYNTTSNTISFKKSDFDEETHTAKLVSTESPSYTVFVQLTNMFALGQQAYVQGNNTVNNSRFTPFFAMNIKGNGTTVADQKALVCPNDLAYTSGHFFNITFDGTASDQQKITAIGYSSNDHSVAGSSYMGNLKFLDGLTQQDFRQRGYGERTYYWYADGGIIRGKYIVSGGNTLTCGVAVPMELEDLRRIACFVMNKIETNVTGAATISDFTNASRGYTTDFTTELFDKDTSNPLDGGTRVSKNFADIASDLCLWQYPYTDMAVDRFTEDLIPEWTPPTPEPEDDERSFGIDYEPNRAYSIGTLGGFITQYAMTQNQIAQFGHYLWAAFDDSDFWDSISVILPESLSLNPSDILKYIISVRMFPFRLAGMPSFSPGSDSKIYIGRGFKPIDINTQMNVGTIDSYTEDIDGGYADIPAFHGDFRDYEPCARAIVTIPFCGSLELVPSQIIGARIHLRYGIDYSSGAIQATVTVENGKKYIAGILNGSIGATVQMTASNLSQVLQGGIKAGAEVVKTTALIAATGVVEGAEVAAGEEASVSTELASRIPSSGANSINSILSLDSVPPQKISMSCGFASMQVTKANVRLEFRHYTEPSNYAHTHGYACDKTVTLGSLEGKGFTVCRNVDLTGVPATQDELAAIEALLQSGVYL